MKKHWSWIGASALLLGSVLPVNGAPAIAQAFNAGTQVAQNILQQPQVKMNLGAELQVVKKDEQGKEVRSWVATDSKIQVKPGDRLRFTVAARNEGNKAAQSFAITQPVPKGTVLVLNSAAASTAAAVTYSIDAGTSFVAQPMVKVAAPDGTTVEKPAPAAAYTHVRFSASAPLEAMASTKAAYEVAVR
jgi:uncharacterized repeat protein (TIGR01451 family)